MASRAIWASCRSLPRIGSHLALARLAAIDDRLERVVLASVEGLDQTVKSPAQTDAYFARLQAAIAASSELAEQFPEVVDLIGGVRQVATAGRTVGQDLRKQVMWRVVRCAQSLLMERSA